MKSHPIEYTAAGMNLVGLLCVPDGDDVRPGVLVGHEGPGISDHERGVAQRLAELGYVAFAIDYHGNGERIDDRSLMFERLGRLMAEPDLTRELGRAALSQLLNEPRVDPTRVAAIGYCFGGTLALVLGRAGEPLAAIVGFHAGLETTRPDDSRNIRARVLMCTGGDDPIVTAEHRAGFESEMNAAGVDWQLNIYGGAQHTFTNPFAINTGLPGIEYHEPSARRSWQAMLDVFHDVFDGRPDGSTQ
jgi:dienelactone hydrolase